MFNCITVSFEKILYTFNSSCSELRTSLHKHVVPERDSNLEPKSLSLLEFETWQIRPLGHNGRIYGWDSFL